jgi:hypothetical protein
VANNIQIIGFYSGTEQIIAVVTSKRFKRGEMTSWKPLTITYNGFSLYPRRAASTLQRQF